MSSGGFRRDHETEVFFCERPYHILCALQIRKAEIFVKTFASSRPAKLLPKLKLPRWKEHWHRHQRLFECGISNVEFRIFHPSTKCLAKSSDSPPPASLRVKWHSE